MNTLTSSRVALAGALLVGAAAIGLSTSPAEAFPVNGFGHPLVRPNFSRPAVAPVYARPAIAPAYGRPVIEAPYAPRFVPPTYAPGYASPGYASPVVVAPAYAPQMPVYAPPVEPCAQPVYVPQERGFERRHAFGLGRFLRPWRR